MVRSIWWPCRTEANWKGAEIVARTAKKERGMALYEHIVKLESVEECCRFFDDLCAITELRAIEQRFEVAKMLHDGMVYTEIRGKTGASSATVSRVNRVLNYGTGALSELIERVEAGGGASEETKPEQVPETE